MWLLVKYAYFIKIFEKKKKKKIIPKLYADNQFQTQ